MQIPQKMKQQWERNPQRVGMILGFVAVPLLWVLQEIVLRLATGHHWPEGNEIRYFIANGALPGAVLGAGISQAYFAHQSGDLRQARQSLLISSFLVLIAIAFQIAFPTGNSLVRVGASSVAIPLWLSVLINPGLYKNFAFQCALLMFFIGLLMRSRR